MSMDFKPIFIALAVATGSAAYGQINSPQSSGYVARAAAMLADGNYHGCIDQCNVALELGSHDREQLAWLQAVAAFRGGLPEARGLLNAFVRQFPQSANHESARLMLATLTFYSGDYPKALAEFKALNANSLNLAERDDLEYRRSFCELKTGEFAAADAGFTKLLKSKQYAPAAEFYIAYIRFVNGEYDAALEGFRRCDATKAPGDMADYYIAQILFRRGDYGEVLNTVMPLLTRSDMPEEFADEASRIAGESFHATGDDQRAMVFLNDYIKKHRDDAPLSTRYIVGTERYQLGDYEEAIRLLAPVTETTDAMGQSAALTVGQAYQSLGNAKAALMAFDKAAHLDFDPKLTEMAYYNYAVAQVDGGRIPFGSSVQTLEEFLTRYPQSRYAPTVQEYLVKGYMATDDYAGALRSLNAIKGTPSDAVLDARQQVNFVLGTRALQGGDARQAESYLLEARKYAKRNPAIARQTTLWLGDAYYALGEYPKAAAEYRAFLKAAPANDPNRATANYNLGYALFAQRDYKQARQYFETATRELPLDAQVDALNRTADTYYYTKEFAPALKAYEQAYDRAPAAGDYSLLQKAMMQGYLGKRTEKLATLNRMIGEFPSSALRPAAMTEKALTQPVADAIETYKAIEKEYPTTTQGRNALLQLGILYDNSGDTESAREYYTEVIRRHPSSSEARVAVDDLKRIYAKAGQIEELNSMLASIAGAPQLDAVEVNAIAAAGLLKKAQEATATDAKLQFANEMLEKYPDAEGSEQALLIAAQAEYDRGVSDRALMRFTELAERASNPTLRHQARMGILRSARDMGEHQRILDVSAEILASSAGAGADIPEVKFIRSGALAATGADAEATKLRRELAQTMGNIYGTRAAFELADADFRRGNLDAAQAQAEEIIDANPPHAYWLARTFVLYSDILRAQGADFEADEYLRVLRSNYPGQENDIFMMIDKRLPN